MENYLQVTDAELRQELERMGYSNIPEDVLKQFKQDLEELMRSEELNPTSPPDSLAPRINNSVPVCLNQLHQDSIVQEIGRDLSKMSVSTETAENSLQISQKSTQDSQTAPKSRPRSGGQRSLLNLSTTSSATNSSSSSSSSSAPRIIKRKILRHKDGESFIEELSYVSNISSNAGDFASAAHARMPQCPDFSYGLQKTKSISRSTGSLNEIGKSGTKKQARMPCVQYGVKTCDPVTRYHHYCQFWKTFKPPGEKSHKKLRWTIREQMLDYDPIVEISLKQIPNMYKIPMERRRQLTRSNSTSSLSR